MPLGKASIPHARAGPGIDDYLRVRRDLPVTVCGLKLGDCGQPKAVVSLVLTLPSFCGTGRIRVSLRGCGGVKKRNRIVGSLTERDSITHRNRQRTDRRFDGRLAQVV